MANYFVDALNGDDLYDGKTVQTAKKTLRAIVEAGVIEDTSTQNNIYVAPGDYMYMVPDLSPSPTAWQTFRGDCTGRVFGRVGKVLLSCWWVESEEGAVQKIDWNTTPGHIAPSLWLNASQSYLRFEQFLFLGNESAILQGTYCVDTNGCPANIEFVKCVFQGGKTSCVRIAHSTGVEYTPNEWSTPRNWLFEKCVFSTCGNGINVHTTRNANADFDIGITARNCLFLTGDTGLDKKSPVAGNGSFIAGGSTLINCTLFACRFGVVSSSGNTAAFPTRIINTTFSVTHLQAVNSNTAGFITGQRNRFAYCPVSPTVNYTGVNDIVIGALGTDSLTAALQNRPRSEYFTPDNYALQGQGVTTSETPTDDIFGHVRPTPISIGAFEATTFETGPLVKGKLIA